MSMKNDPSEQRSYPSRDFVPEMHGLEKRHLLSASVHAESKTVCFPDGHCFIIPPLMLPRTGGATVQSGSVVSLGVANSPPNSTVSITDDGKGDFQLQWDGGAVHSFTGVQTLEVNVAGPQSDQVNYTLTGPTTRSDEVVVQLSGKTNNVAANVSASGPTGITRQKLMGQTYTVVENKGPNGLSTSGLELLVHSKASAHTKVTTH
jgi:hypothetical protein